MKIAYNPKGGTAITSSTALNDDLIFDLTGLKIWAKGTMMGTDWSAISNKPSTYTPSAHTHTTLDINKADATTIGSNQNTFQVLYYDTNTLTGKPEAANGVGVLKLRTNASQYGEIALTSGNNVYTRSNSTLSSGTWDKLLKASTTKVTSGVGLIDGTTITLVNNANTVGGWSINDIMKSSGTRISKAENTYIKLWEGTLNGSRNYLYNSITFLIVNLVATYTKVYSILTLNVDTGSTANLIISVSANEIIGNIAPYVEVYYKENLVELYIKKFSTYHACHIKVIQSNTDNLLNTTPQKYWGTLYADNNTAPDTTWTKITCIRVGKVLWAQSASAWTTARNFTIGNTKKAVDGNSDVTWTLAELGVNNRDIQVNGTSIGSGTLNLKAGTNVTLSNSSGTVTITAKDTYRPVQVNDTSIGGTTTLNLASGNYIAVSNNSGKVTFNLTNSSTTANLTLVTTGTAGGWTLKTLNIANWDKAYTFVNTISTADTDKVINKWDEIVNFLSGIDSDNKLNTLLNSKLSLYSVAASDNTTSYSNTGLYTNTGVTATNMPFSASPYTLLNVNLGNSKYARLALNNNGNINIYNGSTWIPVLTAANASVSGLTITINGVSTTWANTWRPVYVGGTGIGTAPLNITAGTGITISNSNGTVTITNNMTFSNKINITLSSASSALPIIFAATANSTTQSDTLCKKYANLTFTPSTNTLTATNVSCTIVNASTSVTSTFKHKDLTSNASANNYALTAGGSYTAIDKTINSSVISKSLDIAITASWADISGFSGTFLTSGTYIVEIYVKAATGISEGYFSGTMSWYSGTTTSASTDEIVLHRAGSSYTNTLYLRTIESAKDSNVSGSGVCKMQIAANTALASTTYTFKFKRIC